MAVADHFANGGRLDSFIERNDGSHVDAILQELARDPALAAFMQVHDICEERLMTRGSGKSFRFEGFISKEYATVFEVVAPARPKPRRGAAAPTLGAREILKQLNNAVDTYFAADGDVAPFVGRGDSRHITTVLTVLARDPQLAEMMRAHDVREERFEVSGSGREFRFASFIPKEHAAVIEVVASRVTAPDAH